MQIFGQKPQPAILFNGFPPALPFKFTCKLQDLKFHVMHKSLKLQLNMLYLFSFMCISDIQYIFKSSMQNICGKLLKNFFQHSELLYMRLSCHESKFECFG